MINSLVMIAALAAGADGYDSENAPAPEPVVVDLVSQSTADDLPMDVVDLPFDVDLPLVTDLTSDAGNEQASALKLEDEAVHGAGGCDCCYDSYQHGVFGFQHRFYPSPCRSPGNMGLHFPYSAQPKNYYYFRPYNWFHIIDQQKEVVLYGGDPRHPYANELFEDVYRQIEADAE